MISMLHNVTAYYEPCGTFRVRQINNPVSLSPEAEDRLRYVMGEHKIVNISPDAIEKLLSANLEATDLVEKVTVFTFVSSWGAFDGTNFLTNQPSEGIYLLSEWLARYEPTAAPVAIDPNLIPRNELVSRIKCLAPDKQSLVVGFSMIPVNIDNDLDMICEVTNEIPQCSIVLGGIGSASLNLLPTERGGKGIRDVLPIEHVLVDSGLDKLSALSRRLAHDHRTHWRSAPDFAELFESRVTARNMFIPYNTPDIIHSRTYDSVVTANTDTVVSVLIDNRCTQNCYFCSSPKQQLFGSVDDALNYIDRKAAGADVISFNDNDLSNDPAQTIALCRGMVERGIVQPKHGKFGAREFNKELIDALADANFKRIAVGVESFDEDIRRSISKGNFKTQTITQILQYLLEKGIQPEINLIIATPKETRESLCKTVIQALEWIDRGCIVYTSTGLSAVANSPAVMKLLQEGIETAQKFFTFDKVQKPGMGCALLVPRFWSASPSMNQLRDQLIAERKRVFLELRQRYGTEMPIPVKQYATLIILAGMLKIEGYLSQEDVLKKICQYADNHYLIPYVNI